jgi:hypothetical protein
MVPHSQCLCTRRAAAQRPQGDHRAGWQRRLSAGEATAGRQIRARQGVRWKRLLEDGRYRSAREIAEAEGLVRTLVNRLLRLILPTLHVVEAILDGMPCKAWCQRRR